MKFNDAVSLINAPGIYGREPETWADLGCGDGLFTRALESLLSPGSTVFAVDRQPKIDSVVTTSGSHIYAKKIDFVKDDPALPPLNGILMANSLHFVENKAVFYRKLEKMLMPGGTLILVEYDTDEPNRWVPYPLSYSSIADRFKKINMIPSVYQSAGIYGCYRKPFVDEI